MTYFLETEVILCFIFNYSYQKVLEFYLMKHLVVAEGCMKMFCVSSVDFTYQRPNYIIVLIKRIPTKFMRKRDCSF